MDTLDKYEYKQRAEEIKSLIENKEYAEAMMIADTIDWTRVKSVMMLTTVSDLYKINKRYDVSRDVLLLAYERYPGGRSIVYSLCELCIKMNDYVQAVEYYKEFVRIAPKDTGRYILQYKLYEAQELNNVTQIDSLRQQAEMWKKMYDSAEEGTEEQQKYYELWAEAQSDLNDLVIEHIKLLKEDYLNTVDSVVDQLEKSLTGGLSFDDMEAEWERAKESSERYYDSIERIYQLEQLEGKWQDAINGTTDLKNQQAIAKLKDAQLDDLKNQVNLSEYDIQLSEKKLAIAQAQIALEEAQKNKSSMQLKRDAQGNWVYQ